MNESEIPSYYRYWGKSAKDGSYHLLPYHCLDVAAVGWWLLDPEKPLCRNIAKQLGVASERLQRLFSFFLSLHDIGKFARAFQSLVPKLPDTLVPPNNQMQYTIRHDTLGYRLWQEIICPRWLESGGLGFEPATSQWRGCLRAFQPWVEIVTGHHGVPPKITLFSLGSHFELDDEAAAFEYTTTVADVFLTEVAFTISVTKEFRKALKSSSWLLAGATVLADWLGSGIPVSGYCQDRIDLQTYWKEKALPRAKEIMNRTYGVQAKAAPFSGTENLFPFIETPTPLQRWAAEVELCDSRQLFILEDVTGAGKTEAALALAHRLMEKELCDGIYVALPTMATANAMYERLGKAYRRLFDENQKPSLVLAHGARHLSDRFRASINFPVFDGQSPKYQKDELSAGAHCRAWLADSRKKALLAEVGVGTIDQALLGVLPARHQSLRLLGLNRKVLIVDEIHAYDPYMNILLQSLLEAHAKNGGSAILLSATLPRQMRLEYANAFCRGTGIEIPDLAQSPPYPLATHIPAQKRAETELSPRKETVREVDVRMLDAFDQVREVIRKAMDDGRCVCWIRNTVGDATSACTMLRKEPWVEEGKLDLFHSRFAMVDRQRIETAAVSRFGKTSAEKDRAKRILVATQVVEQSLDLDFDVLISDLAPVDLLIQRAGRLHRHVRDAAGNPLERSGEIDRRGRPVFYVFGPAFTSDPSENWLNSVLPGTQAVYRHVGQLWLSQKILTAWEAIRTPKESRELIEGVYSPEAQELVPKALTVFSWEAEGEDSGKRGMARLNRLNLSRGYTRSSAEQSGGWDQEVNIPTRLADQSVTVALAVDEGDKLTPYAADTPFAWELSMLAIPRKDWRQVAETIPKGLSGKIERLKESEPVLKWVEILPLTAETQKFYDPKMGWNINEERADEPD